MKHSPPFMLAVCLLAACQPQAVQPTASQLTATLNTAQSLPVVSTQRDTPRVSYPALEKHTAHGQVRLQEGQLTLSLELYPKSSEADFQTQLLDLSTATRLQATVTDSHGKSYTANGADVNGTVAYTGGTINLTFDNLVPDELLLVEVQAKNGLTNIVQADLATVLAHSTSASPVNTSINFQTTVAAKAIKGLLQNGQQTRARAINLTGLHSLAERITGVSGTAPNLTYADVHPTLVNTALLATDLVATNPLGLTESDYRLNGATVNLNVSGLNGADKVQVQITDAASAVQTNLGNGTRQVTSVTPGGPLHITASAFGSPAQSYTYSVSPATINPTEGGSVNVTVTAAPALSISNFSPAAGPAGTTLVITGSGFTGATAVTIGGANANFIVQSNTEITAIVPPAALDGVVSVTNGGTVNSANSFDLLYRRIHVKANASGSNNGTSWANAYTSLQNALSVAQAEDEIWVAAGTYTPHASDRSASFQLKENVSIYGGFAGTENSLAARTADLDDHVSILSGDLAGNDNYTTPGTSLDENSYHVTKGADNATLDGFTIEGGNANVPGPSPDDKGAGMTNVSASPILTNLTFINNKALNFGGALSNDNSSSPVLNNVVFSNNTSSYGGGMSNNNSSSPVLNQVVFSNNSASIVGGGMSNLTSTVRPTLTDVTFVNNSAPSGGGMANQFSSVLVLNRVSFINNSATDGGGMYNYSYVEATLNNVTFANNSATNRGGGIYTGLIPDGFVLNNVTFSNNTAPTDGGFFSSVTNPAFTLKNVLFWNSSRTYINLDAPNGVIEAASDPFVNSANPNGADGIPRTADDGLRLNASASTVINQGVSGAGVPTTDILGTARNGNPEPGAYEFVPSPLPAHVLVVDKDASGANNGSSWANAFTSLQSALAAADGVSKTEIWIAEGTYTPHASDFNVSFQLKANVALYGGFSGSESARSQRDFAQHVVVLSGDLAGDDDYSVSPINFVHPNSRNVVLGADNAVIDGVQVMGALGAGLSAYSTSPTIRNTVFQMNNRSGSFSDGGSPIYENVIFYRNHTDDSGGGLSTWNATPTLRNVVFANNSSNSAAGGLLSGGSTSQINLYNVSFIHNTAIASTQSDGIWSDNTSTVSPTNCLFYNQNNRNVTVSSAQGNFSVTTPDPFVNSADLDGPDNLWFTADDGLRLKSSATTLINQGVSATGVLTTDLVGNARVGNPEPGAYEYLP